MPNQIGPPAPMAPGAEQDTPVYPPAGAAPAEATPTPQPAPAPQMPVSVPAKPGKTFSTLSHALIGSVLGAVAGSPPPASYSVDPTTGVQTPVAAPPDTSGSKLRRIAQAALIGLAAGSKIDPNDPAMKSGAGRALAGLGAGAEGERDYSQQQDLLKRKQAQNQFHTEQEAFKTQQQAKLDQATNAHILLENMGMRHTLMNADLETNQNEAKRGSDLIEAAVGGGNQIVGHRDMPESEMKQFRQEHPEYLNYKSLLTRAEPKVDTDGNPVIDPKTGIQQVDRMYTLADIKKPVPVTASMIDHLNKVGFPGAEQLKVGQLLDATQFGATVWQGLKLYNEAERDPKNKQIIETTDKDGNQVQAMVNKVTGSTSVLRDPETGKPLSGKVETQITQIFDPKTQQTGDWLINKQNGKHIRYLGESAKDATTGNAALGDYTLTGDAYLASLPPPAQNIVKLLTGYDAKSTELGRGQQKAQYMAAAEQYDPSFSSGQYDQRQKFMEDWNGATGDGASIRRTNTAIGHLGLLADASTALQNSDINFFNKYANEYGYQTGTPPRVAYDIIANKAAGEAAGAIKGGNGSPTDDDIANARKGFDASQGPQQQRAAILNNMKLLETQAETLGTKFTQTMGKSPDAAGKPVIFPQNRAIMQKYGVAVPVEAPKPGVPTPSQPNQQANPQSGQPQLSNVMQSPDGQHQIGLLNGQWVDAKTLQPLPAAKPAQGPQ